MSFLSGKADLLDHVSGLGGWYNRDGKPVKMGDPGVGAYYSDVYQDFLVFKKKTGGVLHQHKRIKEVTTYNQDFIAKKCPAFEVIPHVNKIADKRKKDGFREETTYTYEYYGKEYTAKELKQKGGVFITVDITFNTLLELAPYFPYIVSAASCDKEEEYIVISDQPWPEEEYDDGLKHGFEHPRNYYSHRLAEYIYEITIRYFNPEGREHIEEVEFSQNGEKYLGCTKHPIDENFKIEWRWVGKETPTHWTSPKIVDAKAGIVEMSKEDFTQFIGSKVELYYVEDEEKRIYLG